MPTWDVQHGDCRDVMRSLPPDSVDAIVSDPPYGLAFMGKEWDHGVPGVEFWTEALRVAKPGAHLLAFGGTRTFHRLAVAIEDAGWDIRDCVMWVYGSGFPKSHAIDKAIDKLDAKDAQMARRYRFTEWVRSTGATAKAIDAATGTMMGSHYTTHPTQPAIMTREHLELCRPLFGEVPAWVEAECDLRSIESENFKRREVIGFQSRGQSVNTDFMSGGNDITAPATDAAKAWQGYGTALKPAYEPVIIARKPLQYMDELAILVPTIKGELCKVDSFARMVTPLSALHLTSGFLSIAGLLSNILDDLLEHANKFTTETAFAMTTDLKILKSCLLRITHAFTIGESTQADGVASDVLLAEAISRSVLAKCERLASTTAGEIAIALPAMQGNGPAVDNVLPAWEPIIVARKPLIGTVAENVLTHGTGALNIDGSRVGGRWPANVIHDGSEDVVAEFPNDAARFFYCAKTSKAERGEGNNHPTVKPIALMRYLCRLVTPPGGLVLDPFNGSGSTGCAAVLEGFRYLGCELDEHYVAISRARIAHWAGQHNAQQAEPDLFG
jgi:DNA modification methylase